MLQELYAQLSGNTVSSIITILSIASVGYICGTTSDKCLAAYRIGRSLDSIANTFSIISIILYLIALIFVTLLAYNFFDERAGPAIKDSFSLSLKEQDFNTIATGDVWNIDSQEIYDALDGLNKQFNKN